MRVCWLLVSGFAQELGWGWDDLGSPTRMMVRLGWWWFDEDDGRSGAVVGRLVLGLYWAWLVDYNILLHVSVVN